VNRLTLVNRLKSESGRSGGAMATTIGATGDDERLVNWLDDAWMEIQRRDHGWTWMRKEVEGPTITDQADYGAEDFDFDRLTFTNGSAEYAAGSTITQGIVSATVKRVVLSSGDWTLGTAAGDLIITPGTGDFVAGAAVGDGACDLDGPIVSLTPFDHWLPPLTEGYSPLVENANGDTWRLRQMAWDRFRGATMFEYERWLHPIVYWSISPDERLHMAPTPDSDEYTIRASYYRAPTAFALDADEPDFGEQYHMILVWRALMEVASFDAAPEVYSRAQMNFTNLDREMKRRYGPVAGGGLSYF
jgi:hypothetical protein